MLTRTESAEGGGELPLELGFSRERVICFVVGVRGCVLGEGGRIGKEGRIIEVEW